MLLVLLCCRRAGSLRVQDTMYYSGSTKAERQECGSSTQEGQCQTTEMRHRAAAAVHACGKTGVFRVFIRAAQDARRLNASN